MVKRYSFVILLAIFLLGQTVPATGFYDESLTYTSNADSDYYYTIDTFGSWYINDIEYVEVEIVVDYINSFELFDVELFLAAEDVDGVTIFEYSSGILPHSAFYDGDSIYYSFEVLPQYDWPYTAYLYVSGEFSEDTNYGIVDTLDYSEDIWESFGTVSIYEHGAGRGGVPGFGLFITTIPLALIVLTKRPLKSNYKP